MLFRFFERKFISLFLSLSLSSICFEITHVHRFFSCLYGNARCLYRSSYRTSSKCSFQNQNPPEHCRYMFFHLKKKIYFLASITLSILSLFQSSSHTPLLLLSVWKRDISIHKQLQNRFQVQFSEPKSARNLQIYVVPITYAASVWLVLMYTVPLFACLSTIVYAVLEQLIYGICTT